LEERKKRSLAPVDRFFVLRVRPGAAGHARGRVSVQGHFDCCIHADDGDGDAAACDSDSGEGGVASGVVERK